MRLAGKRAIVTGGARGIGAGIVAAYAREGASVVVADRDGAGAEAVAARERAAGHDVVAAMADVTDRANMEAIAADLVDSRGGIDILVANAGVNVFAEPLAATEEDWRRCMAVDLDGVWNSARAVLPAMLAGGGGSVVALGSVHSFSIIPGCFPYPVAKHAVIGLVRALALEYAARGVRANAICPGYIDTDLARDHWRTFADPAAEKRRVGALHPPGRIGRVDEVAMTAVFLGSDEAPFINAASIVIDGGRSVLYHD